MRTSTSPARGASSSRSSTLSGFPCSNSTDARMWLLLEPASPARRSAVADSRIEIAVQQVDGQVDRHEQHRDEQDRALGQRIVALVDRPEDEPADAGQREDLLDDHG